MKRSTSSGLIVTGIVLACAGIFTPSPADAAFPGTNGRVAFDSPRAGSVNVYSVDPSAAVPASTVQEITTSANIDEAPFGSPDGTKVVFRSDRNLGNDQGQIFVAAAGNNLAPTDPDNAVLVATSTSGDDKDPSWLPDSTRVLFSRKAAVTGATYQLYTVGVGSPATAVPVLTAPSGCDDVQGAVSPTQANLIAFVRSCVGSTKELWLVDTSLPITATNPRNLTAISNAQPGQAYPVLSDEEPDWAPNGTKIAVSGTGDAAHFGGFSQLYAVDPSGLNRSIFWGVGGTGTNDRSPAYSPDGTKLAFTRFIGGTGTDVWTTEVSNLTSVTSAQAPKDITPARGPDLHPTWLPLPGTQPVVPEAPLAVLLPVSGMLLIGGGVWLRRRRTAPALVA